MKGLTNALVIDNNDTSILYKTSDIKSECEYMPTLDELYTLYTKDKSSIFNCNSNNAVTLIYISKYRKIKELNLSDAIKDYYKNDKLPDKRPSLIKISNAELKDADSEIYIYCGFHHYIQNGYNWMIESEQVQHDDVLIKNRTKPEQDLNGYLNCVNISNALEYRYDNQAIAIKRSMQTEAPGFIGYMPAVGQILILKKYIDMINYIFGIFGFDLIDFNRNVFWTSTETSAKSVYDSAMHRHIKNIMYGDNIKTLPFFKKTKRTRK